MNKPGISLSPEQRALRRALYDAGKSDGAIAERLELSRTSVTTWRRRQDLPARCGAPSRSLSRAEDQQRRNLYRLGWSDYRIARACGVTHKAIAVWRKRRNLAAKHEVREGVPEVLLPENEEERRIALYRRGRTDTEIGAIVGREPKTIGEWRQRRGLEPNRSGQWQPPPVRVVSLDAELGENGFNRHGLIADDAAAEWLEAVGASVW